MLSKEHNCFLAACEHKIYNSPPKVTTVASTKGQLVKLIRSLIAFGNTLGELPRERILNIKVCLPIMPGGEMGVSPCLKRLQRIFFGWKNCCGGINISTPP